MGGGGSKSEEQFASSSSNSFINSDGTGGTYQSVFTGSNKDGAMTGQGLTFQQLLPQVATSFVFDFLAIMTVALFTILVIKHYRQRGRKNGQVQRKGNFIMVEMKELDKIETV